jgi:selenocysteine lyase/cysteine desulfurase
MHLPAMNALVTARPSDRLARVRELGRSRPAASALVYLDYTGAALYPDALLREHLRVLRAEVFGNPHSTHPASLASSRYAQAARQALLEFLDADPRLYDVVWTANASTAVGLVAESFPFGPDAPLVLTADNHNAVHAMRQLARARSAAVTYLPLDADLRVRAFELARVRDGLFAYPAQSNFSGVRHPLEWIALAQRRGYTVLLDAAAFVPTNALSLREVQPDFVALSIYKICGYPTGIGALVAKREALRALTRPTFSGGTVEFVSVLTDRYLLKDGGEGFEDGTGNYLAWSAVPQGLQWVTGMNVRTIQAHVAALTEQALFGLLELHHANGTPAVRIHGPANMQSRGATIAFNVQDAEQTVIDFEVVVEAAALQRICLRGGCFCNPGAAERAFDYSALELNRALDAVRGDFSFAALRLALHNQPVGAVRASFGSGSSTRDVEALLAFLRSFLATGKPNLEHSHDQFPTS